RRTLLLPSGVAIQHIARKDTSSNDWSCLKGEPIYLVGLEPTVSGRGTNMLQPMAWEPPLVVSSLGPTARRTGRTRPCYTSGPKFDSSVDCRAAGISLISRAAATPSLIE